jgi:CheY-like chemotaxis protein
MTGAPGPGRIRVLIADDQRVVRDGLSMLAGLIDGVKVVGTACDGTEAVRLAEAHRPDVILMDLRMPGTDGIAATADLRQRRPATRVLVLTTYPGEDAIGPALRAGARGYLTKDASAEQIEAAIHAVHAGQTRPRADSPAAPSSASPRDGGGQQGPAVTGGQLPVDRGDAGPGSGRMPAARSCPERGRAGGAAADCPGPVPGCGPWRPAAGEQGGVAAAVAGRY